MIGLIFDLEENENDVRRWCESAMSLIEDTRKELKVTQTIVMNVREECVERRYDVCRRKKKEKRRIQQWNMESHQSMEDGLVISKKEEGNCGIGLD